ncbi:MAG: NAD(P)/FAD-dependent oxidoreductase [Deltaproteobacteria bacterium]|nr:MAG: NAD(P)/FAD-dependent oxidoreductase [Deltaproteobacteria bacterium]
MSLSYDVLVIGSGMGGMCAAALLARNGLRTVVVERLPRIGGRCSTVEFDGFKCTTGVIGVEMGGCVEEIFRRVGADFHVRPARPPHYLIRGQAHQVPPTGGLRKLVSAASDDAAEVEKLLTALSRGLRWLEPPGTLSLREWLLQYTENETILGIFQTMVCATLLVNADELPASEYFRFIKRLGGIRGFGYCPEGSIALPTSLGRRIEELGGALWMRSTVKRILSDKGIVRGALVSTKEGEVNVGAKIVISNAGPRRTVELLGKADLDRGYLRELRQNLQPAPVMALQIAAAEPLIDYDSLMITGARRVNALYQPTAVCPELAPTGQHLLLAGGGPGSSFPPFDKKKEMELCLQDLEDLIPDFKKRARILTAGFYHGRWPGMHCWPGRDLPQKTPIENLYNVGDGVKPAGTTGLPSAAASALAVVDDVEMRL